MIPTTFDTALAAQFHTDGFALLPGLYGPVEVAAMPAVPRSRTGERPRRVVHLECATVDLPAPLQWRERMEMTRLSEA